MASLADARAVDQRDCFRKLSDAWGKVADEYRIKRVGYFTGTLAFVRVYYAGESASDVLVIFSKEYQCYESRIMDVRQCKIEPKIYTGLILNGFPAVYANFSRIRLCRAIRIIFNVKCNVD